MIDFFINVALGASTVGIVVVFIIMIWILIQEVFFRW